MRPKIGAVMARHVAVGLGRRAYRAPPGRGLRAVLAECPAVEMARDRRTRSGQSRAQLDEPGFGGRQRPAAAVGMRPRPGADQPAGPADWTAPTRQARVLGGPGRLGSSLRLSFAAHAQRSDGTPAPGYVTPAVLLRLRRMSATGIDRAAAPPGRNGLTGTAPLPGSGRGRLVRHPTWSTLNRSAFGWVDRVHRADSGKLPFFRSPPWPVGRVDRAAAAGQARKPLFRMSPPGPSLLEPFTTPRLYCHWYGVLRISVL